MLGLNIRQVLLRVIVTRVVKSHIFHATNSLHAGLYYCAPIGIWSAPSKLVQSQSTSPGQFGTNFFFSRHGANSYSQVPISMREQNVCMLCYAAAFRLTVQAVNL